TDADGDTLTATLVAGTGPSHGTLTYLDDDGSFMYTPYLGYTGTDSFQYTADDGIASDTAWVTITIHGSNSAPVAYNDTYSVVHDHTLTVNSLGVLANDTDADGDPLAAIWVSNTTHGTLSLSPSGAFTYVPNAKYAGTDSFQYQA